MIAYEVLTGEKPFAAEYLPTLLYKIVREEPLAPQRLNTTLGPAVEPVLRKALAKNPADRYETCADFISALATACNATPGWIPLPRGASQNLPTGGSREGLAETVADALPEPVAAVRPEAISALAPAPPEMPPVPGPAAIASGSSPGDSGLPPVWEPRRRQPESEPSHAARNIVLFLLAFALVGMGLFVAYRQYGSGHAPRASENPPSATSAPAPEPPPPPPPQPAASENTAAEHTAAEPAESKPAPVEAKTEPPPTSNAASSPKPKLAPIPADGVFQVTATPAGATAIFDRSAALKCVTPCSLTLPAGRHTFLVQFPGYRDAQRIIDIPHDTGLIVNLEKMSGMLTVSTNPPGLGIVIDGQEQARKSPATFVLLPGQHSVEIVKGSERHPLSVEIHDGSTIERHVDLSQ